MNDKEYLPLSWLSQICYCPRRAAILLNERVWVENVETAKGRVEHERVHTQRIEKRGEFLKLYEYEVGKFLVRAYSKYSKNSSTNIGKIKGKKSYVVYDKKYPEKVQGLFDLASMSILFLIQILVGAGLITMGTFLWSYISG